MNGVKHFILTLIVCFNLTCGLTQTSLSMGFRNSFDGEEFRQNYFGANTHWLKNNFEFVLGFQMTGQTPDYQSTYNSIDSDSGPLGYSYLTKKYYSYKADVSYLYGGIVASFNIAFIQTKSFSLFSGLSLNTNFKLSEKESSHITDYTVNRWNQSAGVTTFSDTIHPTSHEPFDALLFKKVYGSIGLNLMPRFHFNDFFIQGEFSVGLLSDRIYEDINGVCVIDHGINGTCFNYRARSYFEIPIYVSSGLSIGYTF